jgi:oxygen-independent coproporphyrinogen-3 oxidase
MQNDLIYVDPKILARLNRSVPRYTSYPTAPQFHPVEASQVIAKLSAFNETQKPLSIYIHIPFCKSMCLFCGCSVVLNRNPERQRSYLKSLLLEIEKTASHFSSKRLVSQLHLGGGTPTSLTIEEFVLLMRHIKQHFILAPDAEISIEIDPRTVYADKGDKLVALKELGFNRVSFGVQDLDQTVQEAVRRRQTEEMTTSTYFKARELGFSGINIDLIYGLPFQTEESFAKTAKKLIELKPDRIAFYSYAKVPWLKAHQKAIPEESLPSTEEKFQIYVEARARFMQAGYQAIGMDHFSLPEDPLTKAYLTKTLTRNFQGYSIKLADDMLGIGLSSIGFYENAYFQNQKELEEYHQSLQNGSLPIQRGYFLNEEDILRREIIQSWMCHFELDKKYAHLADLTFLKEEALIEEKEDKLIATPLGRLFIRLIGASFDAYLTKGQFSRAV